MPLLRRQPPGEPEEVNVNFAQFREDPDADTPIRRDRLPCGCRFRRAAYPEGGKAGTLRVPLCVRRGKVGSSRTGRLLAGLVLDFGERDGGDV
jgi:hypothetical protein